MKTHTIEEDIWVAVGGIMIGVILGVNIGDWHWHRKAIEAGVASWTCDPQTGHVEFEWKGP